MENKEKVYNIMSKELSTVSVNNSLGEVNDIFNKKHIRHLPVVHGDKLVGILSQTDMLRISFGNTFGSEQTEADEAIFDMLSINQVMKHSPTTIGPMDTIKEAAEILAEKEFHALPVVENDKLVGIITTTDIMRYFIENN